MPLLRVTGCCALAAIGSFLFGYDTGIIAAVIEQDDFNRRLSGSMLSDDAIGGIVSSFTGGAIVGTLVVPFLSDNYGRRAAIFFGALLSGLGGALQCGAINIAMMVIGRIFAGCGVGIMSPSIPTFCLEVSPPHFRGYLGGMQQWMLGLGIVTSQWIGYGSSLKHGPFSWRFPLSIQVLPAILLACSIYTIPESPRSLMERDRDDEAEQSLRRYRLKHDHSNEGKIQQELQEIRNSILDERRGLQQMSWRTLLLDSKVRTCTLLACGIQLFTQTSGVNVIGYYGPKLYSALGYSPTGSLFIQAIYGALALLWNTVCLAFVDRVGRRKLLIPSMIGMGAALCVEATLVHYYNPETTNNQNALKASVAMNFVFSVFFTSLGVISWVFAGEIFSTHMRAKGTSLATFTNWAANLIFAQCSPLALSRMGHRYFYIFAAFNWSAALIVWLYYPETQIRPTLEAVSRTIGTGKGDDSANDSTASMQTAETTSLGKENGWCTVPQA